MNTSIWMQPFLVCWIKFQTRTGCGKAQLGRGRGVSSVCLDVAKVRPHTKLVVVQAARCVIPYVLYAA
jgi:hypothetical protein